MSISILIRWGGGWVDGTSQMRIVLSQPSLAGVGAGAELGKISLKCYLNILVLHIGWLYRSDNKSTLGKINPWQSNQKPTNHAKLAYVNRVLKSSMYETCLLCDWVLAEKWFDKFTSRESTTVFIFQEKNYFVLNWINISWELLSKTITEDITGMFGKIFSLLEVPLTFNIFLWMKRL